MDITLISTLFSLLKNGVEFKKSVSNESVEVTLSFEKYFAAQVTNFGDAVLAFGRITNKSSQPHSVTDIRLSIYSALSERVPITELKYADVGNTLLVIQSYQHTSHFELEPGALIDLRPLPMDIYLRPNESATGLVLFRIPEVQGHHKAEIQLDVDGGHFLSIDMKV